MPAPSKRQIKKAGKVLIDQARTEDERREARRIIHQWRRSHNVPLTRLRLNLANNVSDFGGDEPVGRLKRLPAIAAKLTHKRSIDLSSMQDVVGCRAIIPTNNIRDVVKTFATSSSKHRLIREYDYLSAPKPSGYGGYHLVYQYQDSDPLYHGKTVEIQLRSPRQHAWATAIEVVDTFTGQSLKSGDGDERWIELFRLLGSLFSLREGYSPAPGTSHDREGLVREIRRLSEILNAVQCLESYGEQDVRVIERLRHDVYKYSGNDNADRQYVLLELSMGRNVPELRWMAYRTYREAIDAYDLAEEDEIMRLIKGGMGRDGERGREIVLIRIPTLEKSSILDSIKPYYPNYFADTRMFVAELKEAIG